MVTICPPSFASICLVALFGLVWIDASDNLNDRKRGRKAEAEIATALANRHFHNNMAKWPSRAFVAAAHAAALTVQDDDGAGTASRSVMLMAMANEISLQSTVPLFLSSLRGVPKEGPSAAHSLADHLVMACSSDHAVGLCRALGLGSRWGLPGLGSSNVGHCMYGNCESIALREKLVVRQTQHATKPPCFGGTALFMSFYPMKCCRLYIHTCRPSGVSWTPTWPWATRRCRSTPSGST